MTDVAAMTGEEFEKKYASRSGLTVDRLRELGRVVVPCGCGEDDCQGWASVSRDSAADYEPGGIYFAPRRQDTER